MAGELVYSNGRFTEMNGGEVWGPTGKVLTINIDGMCVGEAREISKALVDALEAWAEASNPKPKQVVSTTVITEDGPRVIEKDLYIKLPGDELDTFGQPIHKDQSVYVGPVARAAGRHFLSVASFKLHGLSNQPYDRYTWDGTGWRLQGAAGWS